MAEKKRPVRRCSVCMEHMEKDMLLRVVRTPSGEVKLDRGGKENGRGAYVCKKKVCLQKLQKTRRLEHAFGVSVPEAVYGELLAESVDE